MAAVIALLGQMALGAVGARAALTDPAFDAIARVAALCQSGHPAAPDAPRPRGLAAVLAPIVLALDAPIAPAPLLVPAPRERVSRDGAVTVAATFVLPRPARPTGFARAPPALA